MHAFLHRRVNCLTDRRAPTACRYTIGNVFIITFLLIFIFSVMGIQLFQGTFASCNDKSIRYQDQCSGTYLQYVYVINRGRSHARYGVARIISSSLALTLIFFLFTPVFVVCNVYL